MKHILLATLTIVLFAQHSLLAMDADAHLAALRLGKFTLFNVTPGRFIQITCCNKAPEDAFTDTDQLKTFQMSLFKAIDSIATIPDAQGDQKSLTMNIEALAHHPFFAQQVDARMRKLQLLDQLIAQGPTNIIVMDGDKEVSYNNEQKQKVFEALSTINALEEDRQGLVFNLATLRKLPSCKMQQAQPSAQAELTGQQVDARTRKLKLLEELAKQDSPNVTICNPFPEDYTDGEKKDLLIGCLCAVDALKEDTHGFILDLGTLQKLPMCKAKAKQELTTQAQSMPAQKPTELTLRQKLLNPTTAAVALTCLAVGYMLRGQGTNQ